MELIWTLQSFNLYALIDVLLVASIFFGLSFLFRGTQAVPALPNLVVFRWLSTSILTGAAVAIPLIFHPEIRRAMERLGRAGRFFRPSYLSDQQKLILGLTALIVRLSARRHGALIVLERSTPLDEFIETGVPLHADFSPQLLLTIFYPKTELHDGAVILRGGCVMSAAAVLPLAAAHDLSKRKIGTRHRAAIGLTEITDAIVLVVSEETGAISLATDGQLQRGLDEKRLLNLLQTLYADRATLATRHSPLFPLTWKRRRRQSPPAVHLEAPRERVQ